MRQRLQQWGRAAVKAVGTALVVSAAALGLLKGLEGFSAPPYLDIAGVWTNGYGNTRNVGPTTPPVTQEQAHADLVRHVNVFAAGLDRCLLVTPTQNQYDALMLWTYNVGVHAACSSTLMRLLNEGALPSVWCAQLLRWNKVRVGGRLVTSRGLSNRRSTEHQLCVKP